MHYAPRVKETTTTTSIETYILEGAAVGYQGFVAGGIYDAEQTWYCCTDGIDWEIGIGTISVTATDNLERTVVVYSSNSGGEVDWGAGTKDIFCIFPPNLLTAISGGWNGFTLSAQNSIGADGDNYRNIAIGADNQVSGIKNIAIGENNDISATSTNVFVAGAENIIDGTNNSVIGNLHTAESNTRNNVLLGNSCGLVIADNALFYSSGVLTAIGDSQLKIFTASVETTDATVTALGYFVLSGSTGNTGTALYEISVVARQTGGAGGTVGDSKSWKLDCMVTFAAGVLAQVGTTVSSVIGASAGASAWTCTIDVSENDDGPIRVTGEANKTIQWVAYVRQLENSTGIEGEG